MKDNLEKFIRDNRSDFDDATPSLKVWANIDRALEGKSPQRKMTWWKTWSVAATVALLIAAGTLLGYKMAQKNDTGTLALEQSEEFRDMASFYERQLQDKTARLASFRHEDLEFKQDLQQIDKAMEELKLELRDAPKGSEQQIINAMIQNYRAKLFVLDRVLQQINSSNQSTKKNDNGTVNL